MSIPDYNRKRRFDKTPEPQGKKTANSKRELQFVIQKHHASHLHYDFRLELDGVLKSWAVPKGLSTDPEIKRLAMAVEDHPFDYKDFEGVIPEGNYGAGTVIVWDQGTYEPVGLPDGDKGEREKYIRYKLHKGELKFRLHGEKMQGVFALVKAKNREQENTWFIYKVKDEFAGELIPDEDRSILSGRTLEEVGVNDAPQWHSNKKTENKQKLRTGKKTTLPAPVKKLIEKGKKSPIIATPRPMLATLDQQPFDDADWLFEIKWDGYRAIASVNNVTTELTSRNNISLRKFYPVVHALEQLKCNAVLDGEIIVMDDEGHASFQMLQQWTKEEKGRLCYMVFDLLWYEGYDLTDLPLTERKKILEYILPQNDVVRYCDHVAENGIAFYDLSVKWGIEGIIAKKADSTYIQGKRSKQWLKLKNVNVLEAVITGFTKGRNSRKYFGALILGAYRNGVLEYIGHTGSGMDEATVKDIYKQLEPLITDTHPFKAKPKTNMPATWVQPKLVCEVKYQERTADGILRIPIFLSLRNDKKPQDLKQEATWLQQSGKDKQSGKKSQAAKESSFIPAGKKQYNTLIQEKELKFTNLDKLYWKDEGITKRDMLNYYYDVAPYMLAYMRDRPQSLNRHPNGISGKSFFQKDVKGKVAGWLETYHYISDSDGEEKDFLVCTDEASLLYIANLGCIEMNPWHSRIQSPAHPDWCVIDLDPDDIAFEKVIETAQVVKQVLDTVNVDSFCKTSGSTGLHIYIPLGAKYSYEQSKVFAEIIANIVHQELPDFTSIERNPAKRRGMIYLDYLQNRNIQTIAAPYSLRPRPGATASAPLHWTEVKKGLRIDQFSIHNMRERIRSEGDLFAGVLSEGIELNVVLEKLFQISS